MKMTQTADIVEEKQEKQDDRVEIKHIIRPGYARYTDRRGTIMLIPQQHTGNCKVMAVQGFDYIGKNNVYVLEKLLDDKKQYSLVLGTTRSERAFDFLKENYTIVYSHVLPLGYNDGDQFHFAFINPYSTQYRNRLDNYVKDTKIQWR